jgi:hypothetical protein
MTAVAVEESPLTVVVAVDEEAVVAVESGGIALCLRSSTYTTLTVTSATKPISGFSDAHTASE